MLPPLLQFGDILVSTDIISEYFSCDYEKCHGICCVEGDSGAPVGVAEPERMKRDYPVYRELMSSEGRMVVDSGAFSVIDRQGDTVTPLIPGSEACAFCHFKGEDILCAIEMAGCTKPVSCRLYPIRVRHLSSGLTALNLHRWHICRPAYEKGKKEGVRVYEFLRGPLVKNFGEEFYDALEAFRLEFENEPGVTK